MAEKSIHVLICIKSIGVVNILYIFTKSNTRFTTADASEMHSRY